MGQVDVSYHVVAVPSADEAESLTAYLSEHGIESFAQTSVNGHEVSVPLNDDDDEQTLAEVKMLKKTWRLFYDRTELGLLELPMFVKDC